MPSPRSFEWVRIQTTNYQTHPTPKIYFLRGFRPLNLENVENQSVINACPFYVDCAVFVSQFRGFRLQCTAHVSHQAELVPDPESGLEPESRAESRASSLVRAGPVLEPSLTEPRAMPSKASSQYSPAPNRAEQSFEYRPKLN